MSQSRSRDEDHPEEVAARAERPVFEETTIEELLEQAQANAQAAIVATVLFLQEKGIPLAEWTASLGKTFDRGWDTPEPWAAEEFLDAMLTNLRALGAEVISTDLAPEEARAEISGFPDPTLCQLFGANLADVAQFNDAAGVLAAERGLIWEWRLDGERTHLMVRRNAGPRPS